jgi:pimeloyl-ACP methyl ester carboxylesterase
MPADWLPVVCVHGLLVSSRSMTPTARQLAMTTRVAAVDLPGFGRSDDPPAPLDIPALADALVAWMDAAGLTPAVLLGNSLGCQVITEAAVRYPAHVERLVLLGPTVDARHRGLVQQVARLLLDFTREPLDSALVVARDFLDGGVGQLVWTARYGLRDRIERTLPLIQAPTLVVRGGRDPLVPQRWAETVTRLLPDGRLVVIPGVGHAVNYNSPEAVARTVRAFMREEAGVARHATGTR